MLVGAVASTADDFVSSGPLRTHALFHRDRFSPEELLSWPERVWGGYESGEASDGDELAILPYDVFAACRLLDTSPDEALV